MAGAKVATLLALLALSGLVAGDAAGHLAINTNTTLDWFLNSTDSTIQMTVTYVGTAWIAIGFSTGDYMKGGDGVIFKPSATVSAADVAEYQLADTTVEGIIRYTPQELTVLSASQANGITSFSFSRLLAPADRIPINDTDVTWVLAAYGSNNTFAEHKHSQVSQINFSQSTPNPSGNAAVNDNTFLSWSIDLPTQIATFNVKYVGTAWIALGFSVDGMMLYGDAIVFKPTTGAVSAADVSEYNLTDTTAAGIVPYATQVINVLSASQANGYTSFSFTRPVAPAGKLPILTYGPTYVLAAYGVNNTFAAHKHAHVSSIDFFNDTAPSPSGQANVNDNTTLAWAVDLPNSAINFTVTYQGNAWIALGFSLDGMMLYGDSIIFKPSDTVSAADVSEYNLTDTTLAGIVEYTSQEIVVTGVSQANNVTSFSFTRPIATPGKIAVNVTFPTNVLAAYGVNNTFAEHKHAHPSVVDFFPLPPSPPPPPSPPSPPSPPPPAPPGKHSLALDSSYSVSWITNIEEGFVELNLTLRESAWFGFGFASQADMIGGDAIIFKVKENTVKRYKLTGTSASKILECPDQTSLTVISSSYANGVGNMVVRQKLVPTGAQCTHTISTTGSTNVLWAYGTSDNFNNGHGDNKSPILINFATGATSEPVSDIKIVHGVLMFLSFGLLMPVAIFFARFGKDSFPAPKWFHIHRGVQVTAVVLALIGFALALKFTIDSKMDHFDVTHSKIGLAVFVAAMLQPLNSLIRPQKGQPMRQAWEALHKLLGWAAIVIAVAVILLGLKQIGATSALVILYSAFAGLLGVFFIILETRRVARESRSASYGTLTNVNN